jgi:hypothetical protein
MKNLIANLCTSSMLGYCVLALRAVEILGCR